MEPDQPLDAEHVPRASECVGRLLPPPPVTPPSPTPTDFRSAPTPAAVTTISLEGNANLGSVIGFAVGIALLNLISLPITLFNSPNPNVFFPDLSANHPIWLIRPWLFLVGLPLLQIVIGFVLLKRSTHVLGWALIVGPIGPLLIFSILLFCFSLSAINFYQTSIDR